MSENLKRSPTTVTKTVNRKQSILSKTFRRYKNVEGGDISRPLGLRHTAHVGASGHNFGDLSFLETGGRCNKTNGLECNVIYDSPVLRKTESIPSIPSAYYSAGYSSGRESVHGVTSDSGND